MQLNNSTERSGISQTQVLFVLFKMLIFKMCQVDFQTSCVSFFYVHLFRLETKYMWREGGAI